MDPSRHTRISTLFAQVCDLPPDERRRRLREECADDPTLEVEVESLVRADASAVLKEPALGAEFSLTDVLEALAAVEETRMIGRRFGSFIVRRRIRAGGMSVVYEAEQDHPHRTVALKVIRALHMSEASLNRFHFEAEVLGGLDHPGIATIYGAGVHADREDDAGCIQYFAMELIDGCPITEYAQQHHLSIRHRMELIARVCDAVQHAHQRGVVHRDLKPANILVTTKDGRAIPKIIDFGVAKALGRALTQESVKAERPSLIGTPEYMSPEQLSGAHDAVDSRSDVYAIGVVLYELLGGRPAFTAPGHAGETTASRLQPARAPAPLDAIDRSLRGDPAAIVRKAMEPNKDVRYQTAAELAADIGRYLANEPVIARAGGLFYYLGKLARRNRREFALAGLLSLTLLCATAVSVWLTVEAALARDRTAQALDESEGVSAYLLDLFLESPDQPTMSRQQLLERAELRLAEKPPRNPRVEAKVREYIGHGWHKLNYIDLAEPQLARALAIRRSLRLNDMDMVKSLHLAAMQRLSQGRVGDGQSLLREALTLRRGLLGQDHMVRSPDDELMYFAVLYTPDEPEAILELERRRQLREQRPRPIPGPQSLTPVLEDEFDGSSIAEAWQIEMQNCSGWSSSVEDSRLTVTGIEFTAPPTDESRMARVWLTQRLPEALTAFNANVRLGWDSEGRPEVIQSVGVILFDSLRRPIASAVYGDHWLRYEGGRHASVGRADTPHHRVNSGWDTLPSRGTAEIAIERADDIVTILWDGHELMRGESSDPLAEVAIVFLWTSHRSTDGASAFGHQWIESVRISPTTGPAPAIQGSG